MCLCVYSDCKNTACYNYEGRMALMCEYHKCDNMIIIKKHKCTHAKCHRIARFNVPNEKHPIYCIDHKLPDMIDLENALYDYDNKRCCMKKRNKRIYESNQPILLVKDKERPLELKNTCYKDGCEKIPKFNAPHKQGGMYCDEHKKMFMINVVDHAVLHFVRHVHCKNMTSIVCFASYIYFHIIHLHVTTRQRKHRS